MKINKYFIFGDGYCRWTKKQRDGLEGLLARYPIDVLITEKDGRGWQYPVPIVAQYRSIVTAEVSLPKCRPDQIVNAMRNIAGEIDFYIALRAEELPFTKKDTETIKALKKANIRGATYGL